MSEELKQAISALQCAKRGHCDHAMADEAIAALEALTQRPAAQEVARFEAGCNVLEYLKQEGAPYRITSQMLIALHGDPEGRPAPQPATPEPVGDVRCEGCGYMTHHREHMGCVRAAKQHTRPAPGVPEGLQWFTVAERGMPDFDEEVIAGLWYTDPCLKPEFATRFMWGLCRVFKDDYRDFKDGKRWHTFGPSHNQITHWARFNWPALAAQAKGDDK